MRFAIVTGSSSGRMGGHIAGELMGSGRIHFLGTSDGLPSADRNQAALLLDWGSQRYLLDCGEGVSRSLKRAGIAFDSIDRLFLSHLHADHCGGFPMFIQSCWLERRRRPLIVHMPGQGIPIFRDLLRTMYLFEKLLPFELRFQPLRAEKQIRDRQIVTVAHATSHLDGLYRDFGGARQKPWEAFSFELLLGNRRRVVYSGDLGGPADLDPLVASPLHLLVVELAHFTPRQLCSHLRGRPVAQVVLTHLGRAYRNQPSLQRLARREGFRIARDGLIVRF